MPVTAVTMSAGGLQPYPASCRLAPHQKFRSDHALLKRFMLFVYESVYALASTHLNCPWSLSCNVFISHGPT